MEIDFEKLMADKSDKGLIAYIEKIDIYTEESVIAALNELKKRNKKFSELELENIKSRLSEKRNKKASENRKDKTDLEQESLAYYSSNFAGNEVNINYYHLWIFVTCRRAKRVSKDEDDLFDRIFWGTNMTFFLSFFPSYFIVADILKWSTETYSTVGYWLILCIINYIYLRRKNRFERIISTYLKRDIRNTALRDYVIVLVVWFLITLTCWVFWFVPH